MEAHRSFERFEHGHHASGGDAVGPHYARHAALAVAVMAAFLAVATLLANEAMKAVVTEETHRADATSSLDSNRVQIDVANGNGTMLRALGAGVPGQRRAVQVARAHERRIAEELRPADARLREEIAHDEHEVEHADNQHVVYELAEVALEVGIVLASVSIIVRRRWLLGLGGGFGAAGVVLLLVGLLVV
ncbi:MAG TPA: DUF4337 family protein [Solirubrobacterales bacterium]|jgi:hypothetical protein|nr:DUF4337 family protein [Solirubrobacterales bacterium]